MSQTQSSPDIFEQIKTSSAVRKRLAIQSHFWFFHLYFSHYTQYPSADFQKEMFEITEDETQKLAVIIAFRGSAKSTIMALSLPIWSIISRLNKRFVVITSLTANQSRLLLSSIKTELETNELLINDFGPFEEDNQEWRSNSLVIKKFDARISAFSTGEGIRGIKHNQYRPDLIICDDIEDLSSVKNRDARNKTHQWLTSDVIPAGDIDTKTVVIGNYLHQDSAIVRLGNSILSGRSSGVYRKYPLIDESNAALWSGKFPTTKEIDVVRKKTENDQAFHREYMLTIISDDERVIHRDWIHFYPKMPKEGINASVYFASGVDLAIKLHEHADYTAIVTAKVIITNGKMKIYVLPHPINKRISFPETKQILRGVHDTHDSTLYIEDVGYQDALIQELQSEALSVVGVSPKGKDKRSRLAVVAPLIADGTILFPEKGAELLISQLIDFGIEKYDDLADAFALLVMSIRKNLRNMGGPTIVDTEGMLDEDFFGNRNKITMDTVF